MTRYSMPGDVFDRIRKKGWTVREALIHINESAGVQFDTFDETHVHFNVIDSKKLLLFLLKV